MDVNPGGREELGDGITLVPPVVGEKPGKSGPSVPEELQERRRDHWMAAMWNNAPTVSGMCFGKLIIFQFSLNILIKYIRVNLG